MALDYTSANRASNEMNGEHEEYVKENSTFILSVSQTQPSCTAARNQVMQQYWPGPVECTPSAARPSCMGFSSDKEKLQAQIEWWKAESREEAKPTAGALIAVGSLVIRVHSCGCRVFPCVSAWHWQPVKGFELGACSCIARMGSCR